MKEYQITFEIEGIGRGSSYLTVEDGRLDTNAAEDEFFAVLRKNADRMVSEANDEERSNIIDHLTSDQEDKLKEVCMQDYHGDKDHWEDAYERFLEDVSLDELKKALT